VECGSGVQDVVVEAVPIPSNCTPTIYYQRPCNGSLCGLDRCVFGSCGTNACALLTKTAPKYGWTKRQVFSPSSTSEFDVAFDAKKNIVVHVWVTNHLNSNSINAYAKFPKSYLF
jgi:hypothetical protein